MDAEDDCASGRLANVHTPLTFQSLETPLGHGSMQGLIPYVGGLFHAVYTLQQLPYPIFLAGALKAGGLLHKHAFIRW